LQINDRHEFPFEIDLKNYIDQSTSAKDENWVYKLHGVLVHSGDLHGGHYFALIKPDRNTRWLKFDDDRVTPVTDKEVLEENYGGEPLGGLPLPLQRNQVRSMKRFTNAYMLVYIRETAIDEVLAPFTEDDTPPHLSQLIFFISHPSSKSDTDVQNAGWMRNASRLRRRSESERSNICS
jgi:ubiquitin carboxyl-terminal hydrolase 7